MELTKRCLINNFSFVAYSMIKNNSFDQFVFAIHQFLRILSFQIIVTVIISPRYVSVRFFQNRLSRK